MRGARLVLALMVGLAAAGCMRRSAPTYYAVDPATGRMTAIAPPQSYAQTYAQAYPQQPAQGPVYAQPPQNFALNQTYIPPQAPAAVAPPPDEPRGRGLFSRSRTTYRAAPQVQQPYVIQYGAGAYAQAPAYPARPAYTQSYAYAPAGPIPQAYTLDSGDKLRIVVFGQEGISNSYTVDAAGNVNMPLIGSVPARGTSPPQLAQLIAQKLKQGYVREPHVTVEVEAYRPFFILGEVTNPGQYPYVVNMTAETAIAIAGGFSPRARKSKVELTRNTGGAQFHGDVPLNYPMRPGDTIVVKERWF
jgi:polysaccharide export outer membrane protein